MITPGVKLLIVQSVVDICGTSALFAGSIGLHFFFAVG